MMHCVISACVLVVAGVVAPVVSAGGMLRDEAIGSGVNHIVSNVPGNFTSGTDVNVLIGADRFYSAGFTGQGTIAANVEAGHIWNGHEALVHVLQFAHHPDAFGATTADLQDRHATWVASHLGGRLTANNSGPWQRGIAPDTDLRSGAIASAWNGNAFSLGFNFTTNSFLGGYQPYFGSADVINSSWGGTSTTGGSFFAVILDGLAAQNARTTLVASAGNSGPSANTISFPGSGYNAITVAALANGGNNSYNTIASFSSRGPQDYADPVNGTIARARAAIDIAAPGTNLHAAFYGGQTGGNHPGLPGSVSAGVNTNFYTFSVQGTSFAAPIVSGGVALLKSASYNTPALASNPASRHTLVVKSVLMNSADKTVGWDNGQVANALGGVNTSQALDYAAGAGAMNLDRAFDQYLTAGTRDVPGLANGDLGTVSSIGWDLGNVVLGGANVYSLAGTLMGGSTFDVTLNWFRDREYNAATASVLDLAQADLNLAVIDLTNNIVLSESLSLYNTAEHLSFTLPYDARYGIRVSYGLNTFGNQTAVDYGLAWSGVSVIPEPATFALLAGVGLLLVRRR